MRHWIMFFVVVASSGLLPNMAPFTSASARAARNMQERRVTWPLSSLTGASSLRLVGYQPATTLRFTLPANWQLPTPGQLTVAYRISPATLAGPAYRRPRLALPGPTLSVRLNGQTPLTIPVTAEAGTHTFVLPAEQFHSGPNQIELSVFLPLKEDPQCLVAHDPDRWFELDAASELALPVVPNTNEPRLAEFPWHFAPLGGAAAPSITFVMPDEPNHAELQAFSSVATALARGNTTSSSWDVQAATTFQPTTNQGPVVLIGDPDRNQHVAALTPEAARDAGWLYLARPTWSADYPVLVIGGPNAATVAEAAAALLDPVMLAQAAGSTLFVADPPRLQPAQPLEVFTLAELGYGEEMVKGTGLQSIEYTFARPIAWSARNGTLDLRLSHSYKLGWSPAPLSVYLNDRLVANVLFDDLEQSTSSVEIPIPEGVLRPGRNTLRLDFNLSIPAERCGVDTLEGFWASVNPKTTFELPYKAWTGYINLQHTPFQFASGLDLANLAIVLPSDSTLTDVAQSIPLLRILAQSKEPVAPRLVRADTNDSRTKALNLVILGAPARQPLLQELNRFLPAPLDMFTGRIKQTVGLRLPVEQTESAVVQGLRSPWAARRGLVVLTGDTAKAVGRAVQLLGEPTAWSDVRGNVAVVTASSAEGSLAIVSQRVANIDAVAGMRVLDHTARALLGTNSRWLALGLPPVAMVVVAVASVLGLRWDRRRKAKHAGGH